MLLEHLRGIWGGSSLMLLSTWLWVNVADDAVLVLLCPTLLPENLCSSNSPTGNLLRSVVDDLESDTSLHAGLEGRLPDPCLLLPSITGTPWLPAVGLTLALDNLLSLLWRDSLSSLLPSLLLRLRADGLSVPLIFLSPDRSKFLPWMLALDTEDELSEISPFTSFFISLLLLLLCPLTLSSFVAESAESTSPWPKPFVLRANKTEFWLSIVNVDDKFCSFSSPFSIFCLLSKLNPCDSWVPLFAPLIVGLATVSLGFISSMFKSLLLVLLCVCNFGVIITPASCSSLDTGLSTAGVGASFRLLSWPFSLLDDLGDFVLRLFLWESFLWGRLSLSVDSLSLSEWLVSLLDDLLFCWPLDSAAMTTSELLDSPSADTALTYILKQNIFSLTPCLLVSSADRWPLQTVWTQIRPDKLSRLI